MKEINLEDKFNVYKEKLTQIDKQMEVLETELNKVKEEKLQLLGRLLMIQELANE